MKQIKALVLKRIIAIKQYNKGKIETFNELCRFLFQSSDAESTSFKERRIISPVDIEAPEVGRLGTIVVCRALEDMS